MRWPWRSTTWTRALTDSRVVERRWCGFVSPDNPKRKTMPKPAKRKLTSPKRKRRPMISCTFCEGLGKVPDFEHETIGTCPDCDGRGRVYVEIATIDGEDVYILSSQ